MLAERLRNLERDLRPDFPEIADMLLEVVLRARKVGVPGRYPGDERALSSAREQFFAVRRKFKTYPHTPELVTNTGKPDGICWVRG